MSAAFYIVLEKPIKGFDHFVNGKALARAGEILDSLAKKSGTKPLMKFWSAMTLRSLLAQARLPISGPSITSKITRAA